MANRPPALFVFISSIIQLALTAFWLVPAASCSGSKALDAGAAEIPRLQVKPAELQISSVGAAIYYPGDRIKLGAGYAGQLPFNLVSPVDDAAQFLPEWSPEADPPSAYSAFAIYEFELPDYAEQPNLDWHWTAPPAVANAWLGLANWQRDSWQWHSMAGDSLNLPAIGDYLDEQGRLVSAVVVLGTEPAVLDWLRVGGNVPPQAALTASQTEVEPGTEVTFDASQSVDLDGTIVLYEWDLNADGIFETSTGTEPMASRLFVTPGGFDIKMRVYDNVGGSALALQTVIVGGSSGAFTDFESGWNGWQPDATDIFVTPEDEIDWKIELSQDEAYSGETSVVLTAENRTDACKLWIERSYEVLPNTNYIVTLRYRFGSNVAGEVGTWTILAGGLNYDPEDRVDLLEIGQMQRESTYNGGTPEYVWLDKQYEFNVMSDTGGQVWVVAGVWGVFEVLQTYYIDDIEVVLTPTSAL